MLNCKMLTGAVLFVLLATCATEAQTYQVKNPRDRFTGRTSTAKKSTSGKTSLSVELLINSQGISLASQQWAKIFSKMGISCRVRQPTSKDKAGIKETQLGKTRLITIVGLLERDGKIRFPGKTFSQNDTSKLSDWLDELKLYGSQGAPKGQPVWGLSKKQFDPLFKLMTEKVTEEVIATRLSEAIKKLDLPAEYPLKMGDRSQKKLARILKSDPLVKQSVKGFSKGTALALILNDHKLGFRPLRTPSGSIQLSLVLQAEESDVWPVGWEIKGSFFKVARKLYQVVPVSFKDVKLLDLLHAISTKTEVAIWVDYYRIKGDGIDIDNLTVSYPNKKTTWSSLLRGVIVSKKMTRIYKTDEAGKPFVWVTTRSKPKNKK